MKEPLSEDRIRQLEHEHQSLDREVRTFTRRAYLTPSEQLTVAELKKRKLSTKDELHALRQGLKR